MHFKKIRKILEWAKIINLINIIILGSDKNSGSWKFRCMVFEKPHNKNISKRWSRLENSGVKWQVQTLPTKLIRPKLVTRCLSRGDGKIFKHAYQIIRTSLEDKYYRCLHTRVAILQCMRRNFTEKNTDFINKEILKVLFSGTNEERCVKNIMLFRCIYFLLLD